METRSRKSRSRTPFTQLEAFSKEFVEKETLAEETVRVTRSTTTTKSKEKIVDAVTVDEVTSTNVRPIKKSSSHSERVSRKWFKTSDYSSEDGENEVSSTKSISLNEKNQIIKDAKTASSNGSGQVSALDLYKKSGRYWDIYPKTDYTYSPYSTDRVEIAPGVVAMPNMSRKTIHSVNSSSDDSTMFTNVEHKQTNTESYTSRNIQDVHQNYKPRQLFNNNHESTYSKSSQKTDTTVWSRIKTRTVTTIMTIITTVLSFVYFGFKVQTSWFTKLHKLTSRVMLMDTWLLWKNNVGNKGAKLTALCVIPLVLLGGWWLWLNLGSSLDAIESETPADITLNNHLPVPEDKYSAIPTLSSDDTYKRIDENEMFVNQQKLIDSLKYEVMKIKSEMIEAEKTRQEDMTKIIQSLNIDKTVYITQRINRCCKNPMFDMESYISRILVNLLNDPEFLRKQKGFTDYLRTIFVARQELEYRLGNITANIDDKYTNLINENSIKIMDGITARIRREIEKESRFVESSDSGGVTMSDQRVKQIVRSILSIYDADKTGLVDYAMESMGAQILSTRCTENYHYGKAVVSVLGIPLWYPVNSPRTLITPDVSPGHCWAFQNFPGFVVIRLSKRIKIEAFSIEHINRLLVPNGEIDSAPKNFEVYGLTEESDKEPTLLGEYLYDYDGESLQFFDVQKDGQIFEIVELRVISNHGNPNYTCLYRFRVHGKSVS